jgi:phosphohistidine phosphatase SixA
MMGQINLIVRTPPHVRAAKPEILPMLARIACTVVLLLSAAMPGANTTLAFGIEGLGRSTSAPNVGSFAHRPECDLCQLVRSAPATEFTAAAHPNGGPSRIILMRHGDKPDDPDNPDLSAAGVTRAEHLATYIPQAFGKPDYIIATARSKHSDRPVETVEPLAQAVGVRVQHDIDDKDFEDLVDEIFSDAAYHGKTVVICWHHGTLPAIAALLGASVGSYPDPWPDDTYNVILDFRYNPNSGSPPTVTRVTEPF